MVDKYTQVVEGTQLVLKGVPIVQTEEINVLGSIISASGSERDAFDHRISCSWKCYHKWAHIFSSSADLTHKINFWYKTMFRSMTWAVQIEI